MTQLRLNAVMAMIIATATLGGCVGGGGDGSPAVQTVEVTDPAYVELNNRSSSDTNMLQFTLLNNGALDVGAGSTLNYATGAITGDTLDGLDIDDADFSNPAQGEFSRIVNTSSAGNLFGSVGIGTRFGDRPDPSAGTVNYNQGWVGVTATTDSEVYTLEGQATFDANWDTGRVNGRFTNLSGRDSRDRSVSNVGTLTVSDASIVGRGSAFEAGTLTGTGIFAPINPTLDDNSFSGQFYGPLADELGSVINVDDAPVTVTGAFQAD